MRKTFYHTCCSRPFRRREKFNTRYMISLPPGYKCEYHRWLESLYPLHRQPSAVEQAMLFDCQPLLVLWYDWNLDCVMWSIRTRLDEHYWAFGWPSFCPTSWTFWRAGYSADRDEVYTDRRQPLCGYTVVHSFGRVMKKRQCQRAGRKRLCEGLSKENILLLTDRSNRQNWIVASSGRDCENLWAVFRSPYHSILDIERTAVEVRQVLPRSIGDKRGVRSSTVLLRVSKYFVLETRNSDRLKEQRLSLHRECIGTHSHVLERLLVCVLYWPDALFLTRRKSQRHWLARWLFSWWVVMWTSSRCLLYRWIHPSHQPSTKELDYRCQGMSPYANGIRIVLFHFRLAILHVVDDSIVFGIF